MFVFPIASTDIELNLPHLSLFFHLLTIQAPSSGLLFYPLTFIESLLYHTVAAKAAGGRNCQLRLEKKYLSYFF
jgi:hypothetical protein